MQLATQHPEWLVTTLQQQFSSAGITVNPATLLVNVPASATREEVAQWVAQVYHYAGVVGKIHCISCLSVAKLVLEYAARAGCDIDEAIDQLGLVEGVHRKARTIATWARTLQRLGEDCYADGLSMSYLTTAAGFAVPENPGDAMEFAIQRREILRIAAVDQDKGKAWVAGEMKLLQEKYAVIPKDSKAPAATLFKKFAYCLYLKQSASDEELAAMGTTRADLNAWIVSYEMQLIEDGHLPSKMEEASLPYLNHTAVANAVPEHSGKLPDLFGEGDG